MLTGVYCRRISGFVFPTRLPILPTDVSMDVTTDVFADVFADVWY